MPMQKLQNIALFQSLTSDDVEQITRSMQHKTLSGGELLFKEGETGNCFYIITSGKAEVVKALDTAEERLLNTLGPGDFLGEMSLMVKDNLRTASVRAVDPTHVLELHQDQFRQLIDTRPSIAYQVMIKLSERLRASDESTITDLRKKNAQLAKAYQELQDAQAQLIEKEKLDHELDMARDIQMDILPRQIVPPKGCDIGAKMVPARLVGGDFYDIIPLDGSRVGIAIGDVSDKGIPAAMFMTQFCTLLSVEARNSSRPERVLSRINSHLLKKNDTGLFVTCIYGIYDNSDHSFSYARAGHEIPIIVDRHGNLSQPEHKKGAALCLFEDSPIDVNTICLEPGSTLLMYTDGATDAVNSQGTFFGLDQLKRTILNAVDNPAQTLCEKLIDRLLSFQAGTQFDDITIVAFRNLSG
jgi:serine phosphatase RsbU (regulator of sigma subunit)